MKIKLLFLISVLVLPCFGWSQIKYRYWFDDNLADITAGTANTTAFELSVPTDLLNMGFHSIHFQLIDTSEVPSPASTRYFIKSMDATSGLESACYWFDNDVSTARTFSLSGGVFQIPADSLSAGFHSIHVRIGDNKGTPSSVATRYFIKSMDATSGMESACYWFDNDVSTARTFNLSGGVFQIPADSLSAGFHSIHVRIGDNHGTPSSVATRYFIKINNMVSSSRLFYSVDNSPRTEVTEYLKDGVCNIDLDMSLLNDGLHTLTYFLADEDQVTSSIRTSLFWKNPYDDAPVVEYRYWLNDDEETPQVVQSSDYSNPFKMDVLLPVESKPFRSSYFYFFIEDGKPAAYAMNDLYFQVKNAAGRTAQENASFADINVRYPIDSLIHLENGDVHKSDSPAENKILWYEFDALTDDSVSFRLDAESTIQLFSPSGVELLNLSNTAVNNKNTIAVHDDGKYYVAVHDVTDGSNTVTLEFNRTDAYGLHHVESIEAEDSIEIVIGNVVNVYDVITVLPLESSIKTVYVSSDDEMIVKILQKGDEIIEMTGVSKGTAIITVSSKDTPSVIKNIKVRVVEQEISIKYDGRYITFNNSSGTVHYTLDGSIPDSLSVIAKGKIDAEGLSLVRAVVINNGYESPQHAFNIDCYYDGETAQIAKPGVLANAFEWCGYEGVVNLRVDGALDNTDFVTIRTLPELRILDLSDCSVLDNELADSLLSGSNMLSVVLPSNLNHVGAGLFAGCNNLAAIVWNSVIDIPLETLGGINNPNLLLYVSDMSQAIRSGITNVIANGVAQRITLIDNILPDGSWGNSNFYCPISFRVQNEITYTHTYSQTTLIGDCGGWETISLPFDVQSIRHKDKGEIIPFSLPANGRRQFWLCALTDNEFVDTDSIRANTPYLIAMPNNDEYSPIYCLDGEVTFSSRKVTIPVSEPIITGNQSSKFTPTFEYKLKTQNVFAVNIGEELWKNAPGSLFVKDYRDVHPFEAYRSVASQHAQMLMIKTELNPGTTDVLIPRIQESTGIKYNLHGIPVEDVDNGLYIQDGRILFRK